MHIASRRFLGGRWSDEGTVVLCAGCHTYFTARPDAWAIFCARWFLPEGYVSFLETALGTVGDIQFIRSEAMRMGVIPS